MAKHSHRSGSDLKGSDLKEKEHEESAVPSARSKKAVPSAHQNALNDNTTNAPDVERQDQGNRALPD